MGDVVFILNFKFFYRILVIAMLTIFYDNNLIWMQNLWFH